MNEEVLRLICSLCYCDHMGDVSNEVYDALKRLKIEVDYWDDMPGLARRLKDAGLWRQ